MNELTLEDKIACWPNGCWVWTGAMHTMGYGSLGSRLAHRVVYEKLVGPIPSGMQLDHLCRNRRCVNPDHLEPVTQQENIARGESRGAISMRTGKCPRGHDYDDPVHGYVSPAGVRQCRTCQNAAQRRRRAKQKAAAS